MYLLGGAVGFFSGDIKRLSEDMKALRPTVMPAVPRLLNRIYDKVITEISGSFIKRVLFNMAMSAKESEIRRWGLFSFRKAFPLLWHFIANVDPVLGDIILQM